MKEHTLGIYPMYLTEKILERKVVPNTSDVQKEIREVTMTHTDLISVGDKITYKKFDLPFTVDDILEKRLAKGNHPDPENTFFYSLFLTYQK